MFSLRIARASWLMLVVVLAAPSFAQDDVLELLRSDLKTQKTALLTAAMGFTEQEGTIFWPIYREYELELAKIGDARIANIKNFATNYDSMTDVKAKELVDAAFKLEEDRLKLQKTYYKKVEKALSATSAARFIQVERQIGLLIDMQIAAEVPLIKKMSTR